MSIRFGLALAERGLLPATAIRVGIRRLLRDRLRELEGLDTEALARDALRTGPVAHATDAANEQHYEVPAAFYGAVLGPHRKYSGCYWPDGTATLGDAERAALDLVCDRARLEDGQDVLELGCGWGSLSLHLAERFPRSRILAVSNSRSQREFIMEHAPPRLEVVTADMNDFDTSRRFDRIVSIEMFEHMRNYALLLQRVRRWLADDGCLFIHVFCHRRRAYLFDTDGDANWMGRFFFTGGLMPSLDLFRRFGDEFEVAEEWAVNGTHYARTAAAWLANLERNRAEVLRILAPVYGRDTRRWYHRWRIFFMACEELFGFRDGTEWLVGHYRLTPNAARAAVERTSIAGAPSR